jgi:hypothetical protein
MQGAMHVEVDFFCKSETRLPLLHDTHQSADVPAAGANCRAERSTCKGCVPHSRGCSGWHATHQVNAPTAPCWRGDAAARHRASCQMPQLPRPKSAWGHKLPNRSLPHHWLPCASFSQQCTHNAIGVRNTSTQPRQTGLHTPTARPAHPHCGTHNSSNTHPMPLAFGVSTKCLVVTIQVSPLMHHSQLACHKLDGSVPQQQLNNNLGRTCLTHIMQSLQPPHTPCNSQGKQSKVDSMPVCPQARLLGNLSTSPPSLGSVWHKHLKSAACQQAPTTSPVAWHCVTQ